MNKYIKKNDNTASRIIEGQAVIMTLDDNTLHTLNGVGTRIWELSDGEKSIEEITKIILDEFVIDEESAKSDCVIFIQELCAKKMLVILES